MMDVDEIFRIVGEDFVYTAKQESHLHPDLAGSRDERNANLSVVCRCR
jgi:hypothetical protein